MYVENPILGLEISIEPPQNPVEPSSQPRVFDDIEIVEPIYAGQSHVSAAYYVSGNNTEQNVIFSNELGLAIEATPNNISIEQLWRII